MFHIIMYILNWYVVKVSVPLYLLIDYRRFKMMHIWCILVTIGNGFLKNNSKSRKENPQKLTELSLRSHPRHLVGKRTAQKDATKDITNDSQLNSYFPYRWSLASLTTNIYFYLFLYLYITRMAINNGTPHLKSLKSQTQKSLLGTAAMKLLGGFN